MHISKTERRQGKNVIAAIAVGASILWAGAAFAKPVDGTILTTAPSYAAAAIRYGAASCSGRLADSIADIRRKLSIECAEASHPDFARSSNAKDPAGSKKDAGIDNTVTASTLHGRSRGRSATGTGTAAFGSIALPFANLPALARIERTYAQIDRDTLFDCVASDCSTRERELSQVIARAKTQGFTSILGSINAAVNRKIAYRRDIDGRGVRDYWAAPRETLSSAAGDCEDFAILKMAALETAGVPMKSMSIIVLQDVRRNLFHAVLSIRTNQGHFILDNIQDAVLQDRDIDSYLPLYSLSAGRGYIHGQRTDRSHKLASSASLSEIAPGEGPGAMSVGRNAPSYRLDPTGLFPIE